MGFVKQNEPEEKIYDIKGDGIIVVDVEKLRRSPKVQNDLLKLREIINSRKGPAKPAVS